MSGIVLSITTIFLVTYLYPYLPKILQRKLSSNYHSIQNTRVTPKNPNGASITLVGAGPGSPDLLTIAAYNAITSADVVICDKIVSKELHALVQPGAVLIIADKIPGQADEAQGDLNKWGIDALRKGQNVVRLKAGDPFLYGRGGEEVLFYRENGFEPVVIPGISSSIAAAELVGIPVTHRGAANSILVSTGQGRFGEFPSLPTFDANRTLVLLMAVGRIPTLKQDLVEKDYPVDIPVAVIERASQPDQKILRCTLDSLLDESNLHGVASPAVIVVGFVVNALESGKEK